MSWSYIVKLALAIFFAQVSIGFLDGFFAPGDAGVAWFVGSEAVSLVVCGAIFTRFASRQPFRPFTHAWIALVVHVVAGFALAQAVRPLVGSAPPELVAIGLLIVICALIVGTAFGISLRRGANRPAEA